MTSIDPGVVTIMLALIVPLQLAAVLSVAAAIAIHLDIFPPKDPPSYA